MSRQFLFICLAVINLCGCAPMHRQHAQREFALIQAHAKTDDVDESNDAADDPCIFVNRRDPSKSLVLGTDKKAGLAVYDLSGKRVQMLRDGKMNNVDIRYDFVLGDQSVALISVSNRTTNTLDFYYINDENTEVKPLAVGKHPTGMEVYGSCMYKDASAKKMYAFANNKNGDVIQWEVAATDMSNLALTKVRQFAVDSQTEGCVADDKFKKLYLAEEALGIWQFGADPQDGTQRKLVDHTKEGGNLVADVEGLTIYQLANGDGYLLASSQGENAFNIYDRKDGRYLGKFRIEYNAQNVEHTDGIDVTSQNLGAHFPNGLLVVQDGNKSNPKQSFKLVSWANVAKRLF